MSRSLLLKIAGRAKSLGAVDAALRYHPFGGNAAAALLQRYSALNSGEAAAVRARLDAGILHAARKTPYGKGRTPDLGTWPILHKHAIYEAPEQFICRRRMIRIPAASSGTSGTPVKLWRSLENVRAEQAFLDALLAPYGLSMRSRTAVLRADSIKPMEESAPPFGRMSHNGTRLTLSTPHLNAATLPWYVQALECFAPTILFVYPSAVLNLFSLMERTGASLKIPMILASSEILSEAAHCALEKFFGAQVINYYGQAERVCLAYSTRAGEFYFHPCYGHVELENPAPSGDGNENTVKVIATGYWNKVMPLVRYDTGDLIYVPADCRPAELDEIARGERPFSGIGGRDGEYVLTRDRMRIIGLNHIPREVENVAQVQLVQPDFDTLLIRVIALPGYSNRDADRLLHQAHAKIPSSMRAMVEVADRLAVTARGKTPFVIRHVS